MEPNKQPKPYQGGKVRPIRFDYTGILTMLLVLLVLTGVLVGCVIARRNAAELPPEEPVSEVSASAVSSEKAVSSEASEESRITYLTLTENDLTKGDLLLVNRTHPYDATLALGDITNVRDGRMTKIQENNYQQKIGVPILAALEAMQTDMVAFMQDKMVLLVNAGYRTADDQKSLIESYTESYGEEYVQNYVAPVGQSEHHTQFAADISFYDLNAKKVFSTTSEGAAAYYSWVLDHCRNYGLILRYTAEKADITGYSAESWHFRYVGLPHAVYMAENDLALEEYHLLLKNYSFAEDNRLKVSTGGHDYEIYYVAMTDPTGTQVPIPTGASYTVSGNNADGFIVTLTVK